MFSSSGAEASRRGRVRVLAASLYAERYGYLLGVATKNAANRADAEEAVQEAFVSFIRAYEPERGAPPLAWLTLTLKRECWARRRRGLAHRAGQEAEAGYGEAGFSVAALPAEGLGTEEAIERSEEVLEARERLAQLKADERRALLLVGAGYSYKEIGSGFGWSYTKINRCLAEGRAALRDSAVA